VRIAAPATIEVSYVPVSGHKMACALL